jgi:3-hydroxyacyl-[acyl-carrier-protein] dehydratase
MLKDSLYKIISLTHREDAIAVMLEINKDHEIFTGHFPGHPVLPGACMLQILKEVLESGLDRSLRLKKADSMKFLSLTDPMANSILELNLSYSLVGDKTIAVVANLGAQNDICFKFKGSFIAV